MTTKFAHEAWAFNSNAVGMIFGIVAILLSSDTRGAIVGLAICLMFCTTQICHAIKEAR